MSKPYVETKKLVSFLNKKYGTDIKLTDGVTLRKEMFTSEVSSINEDDGTCECVVTCQVVDRGGDYVVASGVNTEDFQKIPSVYISHNYAALPIAKCLELNHKMDGIHAKIQFALAVPEIKYIWERIKAGVLRGVSVGFEVKEMLMKGTKEFNEYVKNNLGMLSQEDLARLQRIFTKWDMYEFSICGVPANQACYIKSLPEINEALKEGLSKYGYEAIGLPEATIMVGSESKSAIPIVPDPSIIAGQDVIITQKEIIEALIEVDKQEEAKEAIVEAKKAEKPCDCENCKEEGCKCDCHKAKEDDRNPSKDDKEEAKKEDEKPVEPVVEPEVEPEEEPEEPEECEKKPKKSPKKKEIMSYWEVIRTPEEVEKFVSKSVEAKLSGKINITF